MVQMKIFECLTVLYYIVLNTTHMHIITQLLLTEV